MEEDAAATNMDEEYEEYEDENEEVIAVAEEEVEPEEWVKHTKAASCVCKALL